MKWIVEVAGSEQLLQDFSFRTQSRDPYVQSIDGRWVLAASLFQAVKSQDEARRAIDETLFGLNAYAKIFLNAAGDIWVVDLRSVNGDGVRTAHVHVVESISSSASLVGGTLEYADGRIYHAEIIHPPVQKLPEWMALITTDEKVRKLERLLTQHPHDWVNLHRIIEVIEADLGGQNALIERGYSTKEQRSLFGSTANNPGAIGDLARHGHSKQLPPASPMSLEAARTYVLDIRRRWVKDKLGM